MRRVAATVAAIGLMLVANEALAQTPAPVSPIAGIEVSPRMWYVFESFGPPMRKQPLGMSTTLNGDEYALGGATLSARFVQLPETTFILSGLYGTNDPAPLNTQTSNLFLPSFSTATTNTSRLDLEFLMQTAIPETSAAWILGGRFERHDSTGKGLTLTPTLIPSVTPFRASSTTDNITVKGGVTGAVPLTLDHNLRLFGNAQIAVGGSMNSPGSDFGLVGPDLAIGLQYAFSPTINADLRYRTAIYFLFDVPRSAQSLPQYVVYQGPMIGINIKF